MHKNPDRNSQHLREISIASVKLGCIGFGGIAGMIATIEDELVIRRKWVDHKHFLDIVSMANVVPGPNSVEIVMHCGKERGGRMGLVIAGIAYILPASVICLLFGLLYTSYGQLPRVQDFLFGIRPATTALVIGTVFRLAGGALKNKWMLILLAILVFGGSLAGVNEVLLILVAGIIYSIGYKQQQLLNVHYFLLPFLFIGTNLSVNQKLFLIFLKIGAILYGSGYVLFAYMDNSLVQANHWLTKQQLMDAIAVGQITPGPILSGATFAGYLVSGVPGGVLATVGIFLPSFFISFFLHRVLSAARENMRFRAFLDGLNAASIAVIAAVGYNLLTSVLINWREAVLLLTFLLWMLLAKRINTALIIVVGALAGYMLLQI